MQELKAEIMQEQGLLAQSLAYVHFPYTAYTHLPRDCATQSGLSPPILVKTVLDRHAQGPIQSRIQAIPQPRLLLSDDWRLFKLTIKTSLTWSPP